MRVLRSRVPASLRASGGSIVHYPGCSAVRLRCGDQPQRHRPEVLTTNEW